MHQRALEQEAIFEKEVAEGETRLQQLLAEDSSPPARSAPSQVMELQRQTDKLVRERVGRLDQRAQLRLEECTGIRGLNHSCEGGCTVESGHSPVGINFERRADGRVVEIFTDGIDHRGVGRKEKTRAGGGQPAVGITVNVVEPSLRARYGLRGVRVGEASHPGPVASQVRPRMTEEASVRERSPDEDTLDSLEVALTRTDSSDEVRPTMGRNVLRKVGMNSDNVLLLSTQVARRQGNQFEALADSSAAPDPAPRSADRQGRHAELFDARVPQSCPQRVHAQFDLTEGDSDKSTIQEVRIRQNPTRSLAGSWDDPSGGLRQQLMQD